MAEPDIVMHLALCVSQDQACVLGHVMRVIVNNFGTGSMQMVHERVVQGIYRKSFDCKKVLNNPKTTDPKFADTRPGPDHPTMLDIIWYADRALRTHADCSLRVSWFKPEDCSILYKYL